MKNKSLHAIVCKVIAFGALAVGANAAIIEWNSTINEWSYTDRFDISESAFQSPGSGWMAGTEDGTSGPGNGSSIYVDIFEGLGIWFVEDSIHIRSDAYVEPTVSFDVIGAKFRDSASNGPGEFYLHENIMLDDTFSGLNQTILNHTITISYGSSVNEVLATATPIPEPGVTILALGIASIAYVAIRRRRVKS